MRLYDSNPGSLMTNPEREMGRKVKNPEAVNPVMRNIRRVLNLGCRAQSERNVKYTKVSETKQQMVVLIITLMLLTYSERKG